jgi:hypothetical protein
MDANKIDLCFRYRRVRKNCFDWAGRESTPEPHGLKLNIFLQFQTKPDMKTRWHQNHLVKFCRVDWIRTSDPLHPIQVRYRAAPPPEYEGCKCKQNSIQSVHDFIQFLESRRCHTKPSNAY